MDNSIYALCSSNINLSACVLQYSTNTSNQQYTNLSSSVVISLNMPYKLPIQLTAGTTYYFQATVTISPTFQIINYYNPLYMYVANKEMLIIETVPTNDSSTTCNRNVLQLFEGYQVEATIIAILFVTLTALLAALIWIIILRRKG